MHCIEKVCPCHNLKRENRCWEFSLCTFCMYYFLRDHIPKVAFIYPLNSKTFNLEVWHFIITHLDWHGLTHMVLSGYTRTTAKELQKINPWFLNNRNQKKKKGTGIKTLDALHWKEGCARHNLKRQNKALLKPHIKQFITKRMERSKWSLHLSFP